MAEEMSRLFSASSKESEIDALLDALIAKIMTGRASDRDMAEYQELLASRTRLMKPKGSSRYSSSRAIYGSGSRRRYA